MKKVKNGDIRITGIQHAHYLVITRNILQKVEWSVLLKSNSPGKKKSLTKSKNVQYPKMS